MEILFYDASAPTAYDLGTLKHQGLGGTEATVVRIAHALKDFNTVYIAQHCRENDEVIEGVQYLSFATAHTLNPSHVVLLRQYRLAAEVAQYFPTARKFLWLHNMPSLGLYKERLKLQKHQFEIIAVSKFHRAAIAKRLKGNWLQSIFNTETILPIHVLYNPIADLQPNDTPWKPNQLIFTSSPHKGLAETLKQFERLRQVYPDYYLLVANPGYQDLKIKLPEQVQFLGSLPHDQVIQHVRESFCVFYPQYEREETFGLVYAEANAVGTPVLAHDHGAAREVLSHSGQLVNGRKFSLVLEKINEWRDKRLEVRGKKEFRLEAVTKEWLGLLNTE